MSKFKDILTLADAIGKPFLPPVGGTVLDNVTKTLSKPAPTDLDTKVRILEQAVFQLAQVNDEQTTAIQALGVYAKSLEGRILALENN